MGLLDSLFQAQTYGGEGGGLLDMLRQFQMQQQYQPSAGFPSPPAPATFADRFNALPNAPQPFKPSGRTFDSANYDPDTYANQAQPIAVGDYMMPRFGPAHLYEPKPQEAAIPPNAQPAVGQMPPGAMPQQAPQAPQQMMPQQQTMPSFLGGQSENPLMTGLQGFIGNLHNGPIGALAGGLGSLVTGKRTDPGGIAQQNLRAQFEAYRAAGLSPEKAMLAVMNPKAAEAFLPQIAPTYTPHNIGETAGAFNPATGGYQPLYTSPKTEKLGQGESLVQLSGGQPGAPRTAAPIAGSPTPQPKFDDISGLRKEITALPEVKRFSEATPIFRSMVQSHGKDSAAADLDFVYGVAKVFDPDSVVREGEMKLVGQAQSIPEDVKGFIKRVAFGEGRLTPEARYRILEVAQTRMNELKSATDQRLSAYPEIAKRHNIMPQDVMPVLPSLPTLPAGPPTNSPLPPSVPTATNPQTGEKIMLQNGRWVPVK